MPIGTPIIIASATENTPSISEMRAPWMTRENRSRPSSSVPNQCSAEGGISTFIRSFWYGS